MSVVTSVPAFARKASFGRRMAPMNRKSEASTSRASGFAVSRNRCVTTMDMIPPGRRCMPALAMM